MDTITETWPEAISPEQARDLTDRIKTGLEITWQLVIEAYQSRAWAALGYATWDDYCHRELEVGRSHIQLPRENRQEVVRSLSEAGMSTRAITAATGAGYGTVHRDLGAGEGDLDTGPSGDPNGSPDGEQQKQGVVEGIDGKSYASTVPETAKPKPEPKPKPKRRPFPGQFSKAVHDLSKALHKIERLRDDDRYRSSRDALSSSRPELRRAADVIKTVVDELEGIR